MINRKFGKKGGKLVRAKKGGKKVKVIQQHVQLNQRKINHLETN